jgi:hypothetical protein
MRVVKPQERVLVVALAPLRSYSYVLHGGFVPPLKYLENSFVHNLSFCT